MGKGYWWKQIRLIKLPWTQHGGLLGDFAFVPIDLAYNSNTQEFENVNVFTGYIGMEHDWSSQFTSSLGYGVTSAEEKAFFNNEFY